MTCPKCQNYLQSGVTYCQLCGWNRGNVAIEECLISKPVTKEEREKWLKKAEYGGKTRRLIDHLNIEEERAFRLSCFDNQDCNTCPINDLPACDEICRSKSSLIAEVADLMSRADRAEAERDKLAAYLGSPDMGRDAFPPCEGNGYDCYICPFTGREMQPVECWLEWVRDKQQDVLRPQYKTKGAGE